MRRVIDRDHLIDGRDLLLDRLDPERQLLDFDNQIGGLPLQFLFNPHVVQLQR